MRIRILTIILVVALIPAMAIAQRGGGFSGGHGGFSGGRGGFSGGRGGFSGARGGFSSGARVHSGFGAGIPTGGMGVHPGFGNINHPGTGFVPSAPGIGFPTNRGNHIIVGSPFRRGVIVQSPFRHHFNGFRGNTIIFGVPFGFPSWGFDSTFVDGYGYSYGAPVVAAPAGPAAPNVIIIEPGAGQGANEAGYVQSVGTWAGPSNFDPRNSVTVYRPTPTDVPDKPAKPLTLLVFNDHSIYAATDYWKEGNRVCYTTNYGSRNCVAQDQLDLPFTKKLNAERHIVFDLR